MTAEQPRGWAARYNRVLMIVAAGAFVLLLFDRVVAIVDVTDDASPASGAEGAADRDRLPTKPGVSRDVVAIDPASVSDEPLESPTFEGVFGARLMVVSLDPPGYVITGDMRRYPVGSPVGQGYRLVSATTDAVTLERDGRSYRLPLDVVQATSDLE